MKADEFHALELLPFNSLLLITCLQLVAHQTHLPIWLIAFVVMVCLLRFLSLKTQTKTIHNLVRISLILTSTAVFILYYRTNFSVDMAAAFLFLSVALKMLEIKSKKDVFLFIYTMIYLSAVGFLFDQGILHTILHFIIVIICFYVLFFIQFEAESATKMHRRLISLHAKSMSTLLVIAIPIVLVFFLFFPRISPLWQMPLKNQQTKVGMSSELSPGDVSQLAQSSEPAFRVSFVGTLPNKQALYWKGLILDHFDGRKWTQSALLNVNNLQNKLDTGRFFETQRPSYQVILEPHQQKWVFTLDGSSVASSNVIATEMGLHSLYSEAFQPTRYQMSWSLNDRLSLENIPQASTLLNVQRLYTQPEQDLQLPQNQLNPETQAFIQRLQARIPNKEALLIYLLKRFSEDEFFYTLKPAKFGDNFIDEFLFEKKSGFCGHYASSLAYMLRLANIPSRVVMGYQGGEYNANGKYWLISQYDAHAWVEAYLPETGWIRVDPTAMVAPTRILDGSRESLGNESTFLENNFLATAALKFGLVNWMRLRIDEINFQWQKWVVNYHHDQQTNFIVSLLGEYSLLRIAMVFVYFFVFLFVILMGFLLLKRMSGFTWAQKKYLIWLYILGRFGFNRLPGESPRQFLERLKLSRRTWLVQITEIQTQKLEQQEYAARE